MSFTQTAERVLKKLRNQRAADTDKQKQAILKFKIIKNTRRKHLKHSVAKTANFK